MSTVGQAESLGLDRNRFGFIYRNKASAAACEEILRCAQNDTNHDRFLDSFAWAKAQAASRTA